MGAGEGAAVEDVGVAVVLSDVLLSAAVALREHSDEVIKAKINGFENVTSWSSGYGVR